MRDEITGKRDELAAWVADNVLDGCFESTDMPEIAAAYAELVAWVCAQPQLMDGAKAEFTQKADAWLMSYARLTGKTVVTHEVLSEDARRKVPIPNVCEAFNVDYVDTFDMLSTLGASYHWNQPPSPAE